MGIFRGNGEDKMTQRNIVKMLDNSKKQAELNKNKKIVFKVKTMDGNKLSFSGKAKVLKQKYISPKKSIVNMTMVDKKKLDLLLMKEKQDHKRRQMRRRNS